VAEKNSAFNLLKNEQAFKSLFEQNPDPVFSLDRHGNFTSANAAAIQLAECSEEELLSRNFASFCNPKDLERIEAKFSSAQQGASYNFEIGITTAKGNRRYLNVTNMPVVIDGEIAGIYCIAKDITERKLILQERELEYRINQIFNSNESLNLCLYLILREICNYTQSLAGEAWLCGADNKVLELCTTYFSDNDWEPGPDKIKSSIGEGLAGKAKQEKQPVFLDAIQSNSSFLRPEFARKYNLQSGVAIPLVLKDEVFCVLTFYTTAPESKRQSFQLNKSLLAQLAGEIHHRKAEEELSRFFTLTPDMLCVAATDGYLKKINGAFNKILGYSGEEILARPFIELVCPEDRFLTQAEMDKLYEVSQTIHIKNRCLTKDGQPVWVEWMFTSLVSEDIIYGVGRDITEAKKLEKLIWNERQRFWDMFNEAPVTMCILKGPHQVFESANELYYKFSGRRNIIGKPVREVFPEAQGQGIFELMDRVYQTGEFYTVNERLVQLVVNGEGRLEDFYLSFMFQPYFNEKGEVEGIFYFGVDVTEQVKARKKIEESEKQYIDLIQNLPVAVYSCDAAGYIRLFNKAAVLLWGREPQIGTDLLCGAWEVSDKDGEPLSFDNAPLAVSLREGRPLQNEEIIIKRPDGTRRNVVAFPSPVFDTGGKLTGAINVLVDITQRKEAEEALKMLSLIARKTINAVIITGPDEKIEWVNEAFTRITGYQYNEVMGKRSAAILHGEGTDKATVQYMRGKIKRAEPFACELLKYTRDGQSFWVEIEGQPLFDSKGRLTHYFEIETDVTERKKAYEKLVRTENEIRTFARQLNTLLEDERSRIAREIHDEFGQQLTGLKMSLSSLKHLSAKNERGQRIFNDIMEGVESTIQSLRKFSTELRPGILDTLGLAPSIEWLAREFEKRTRIQCQVKIKIQDQVFDKTLSITFFRVCQEALTNISKHAEASKVVIELMQTHKNLSLAIKDNGKGIQTEKLENPFSMGLIGMRERANLIGGQLEITNRNNKGTMVQLIVKTNG
jgi:PAS domain S-box-containing protein